MAALSARSCLCVGIVVRGHRHFLEDSGSLGQLKDENQVLWWSQVLCHILVASFHVMKNSYPLYVTVSGIMLFGSTQQISSNVSGSVLSMVGMSE